MCVNDERLKSCFIPFTIPFLRLKEKESTSTVYFLMLRMQCWGQQCTSHFTSIPPFLVLEVGVGTLQSPYTLSLSLSQPPAGKRAWDLTLREMDRRQECGLLSTICSSTSSVSVRSKQFLRLSSDWVHEISNTIQVWAEWRFVGTGIAGFAGWECSRFVKCSLDHQLTPLVWQMFV